MVDLREVRSDMNRLGGSNGTAQWEAARSLKRHEPAQWEDVPGDLVKNLVETLREQLPRREEANGQRPPSLFRQEVAVILGNIGPRAAPAVPQLADLLADNEAHGVREAAVTALGRIGKPAVPAVEKLLSMLKADCRVTLAVRVARALGDIGKSDQRVQSALMDLWRTSAACPASRVQIAVALCKLRCDAPGLISGLTASLVSSPTTSLRMAAAEALVWCSKSEPDVVPALLAATFDDDENIRRVAAGGLELMKLTQAKAVQICAAQLRDAPHAETALRRVGEPAVPALIKALADPESVVREKAARALGAIGAPAVEAAATLRKALRDKCSDVRLSAAKALWLVTKEPEPAVDALADLLTDRIHPAPNDAEARRRFLQSVIEALGRIGPPAAAALKPLRRLAKDDNRLIRESATRSVRQIEPAVA